MDRRTFLKNSGKGAALLALPNFLLNACQSEAPPNIIFIMTDDHAIQATGCYGSIINQTPNIDRIAAEGVRFENSFVTNSICGPSRAVLLTGKYSHQNGMIDNLITFDGAQQTFPKLLQKAGYETAVIGKWHLRSAPTGFHHWHVLPGQGHYYNPDFINMGERHRIEGYVTDIITDLSLDWLAQRTSGKPFCLLLHHKAPHRNWMPGPKQLHLFRDKDIPAPKTFFDDYQTRSDAARDQEMTITNHMFPAYDLKLDLPPASTSDSKRMENDRQMWESCLKRMTDAQREAWQAAYRAENEYFRQAKLGGRALAEWKYQRYIKDYLRCIASVDENIGRVLAFLDDQEMAENTLLVYTSDQGFYLGEHGWYDKRFMYEESLRMPLVMRYPNKIAPATTTSLALNLDFSPTFLDYAGVKAPKAMQGESLRPVLESAMPDQWRQSLYYHYYEYPAVHAVKRHYGVRTENFKLIHFYYDIDAWELYDLAKDPNELNNVYDDPAYAVVVKNLKRELARLRTQYQDNSHEKYMPKAPESIIHKAKDCPVTFAIPYAAKYSGGTPNALTDGIRIADDPGTISDYKHWQGFEEVDLDATIDLGKTTHFSEVALGCLHHIFAWIFLPEWVQYEISDNGADFHPLGKVENNVPQREPKSIRKAFTLACPGSKGRYIRVFAKNIALCPDWHRGAGGKAWVFADELVVK